MTIRRWIALALVALLAVTFSPPSSRAQIPMIANGLVHATNASVSAANTTGEVLLYQYQLPAALIASWSQRNSLMPNGAATPLHLSLNGTITTNSTTGLGGGVGAATLGVGLGTGASMALVNGALLPSNLGGTSCGFNACAEPVAIDLWFSPIATGTTSTGGQINCAGFQPCQYSLFMSGRFRWSSRTTTNFSSESAINFATLGTINVLQPQTLNVLWRWASASNQNSLNIYNGVLKLGY